MQVLYSSQLIFYIHRGGGNILVAVAVSTMQVTLDDTFGRTTLHTGELTDKGGGASFDLSAAGVELS